MPLSTESRALCAYLAAAIADTPVNTDEFSSLDGERLFLLAEGHGLSGIVSYALEKYPLPLEKSVSDRFFAARMKGVFTEANQTAVADRLGRALHAAAVPHVFLKGHILRDLYPARDMRTLTDLDVLVRKESCESAKKALCDAGFSLVGEEEKDIHFTYPPLVHIELHHALAEHDFLAGSAYFDAIFDRAVPTGDGNTYRLTDEDNYLYLVFHIAKHFIKGGCGIRPLLDMWLYKQKVEFDRAYVDAVLKKLSLFSLERALCDLAEKIMAGQTIDGLSEQLLSFMLMSGTFGRQENRVGLELGGEENMSRIGYFCSRAFPSRKVLMIRFPVLKKHPVLLPFCWIIRFFDVFRPQKRARLSSEIKLSSTMSAEKSQKIVSLYDQLGIYDTLQHK